MLKTQRDKAKLHFAKNEDTCHVKNEELHPKLQKCEGRVVLRGDIVKDNSGAHAVSKLNTSLPFPKLLPHKVMCVISRLPQAADAVSAYPQVKFEDNFQSHNVQTYGHVFHDTDDESHGQTLKILWCFLNENYMVIH